MYTSIQKGENKSHVSISAAVFSYDEHSSSAVSVLKQLIFMPVTCLSL